MRLLKRRGAALPGLIVEKINPSFITKSLDLLSDGVIVITGTNGKTTSTKMLTQVLGAEKKVLTNPTGSNFIRGVISSVVQHSKWSGKLDYDVAVIELDEAYAAKFVNYCKPKVTVVLNVMRDQMDRFGEIDYTAQLINKVVANTTEFVVLNRDDLRVASMATNTKIPVYYFGVEPNLRQLFKNDDELHDDISNKKSPLKAIVELERITDDKQLVINYNNDSIKIPMQAKGTYNAQNAIAVIATALVLNISVDNIATQLSKVKPAFGRGEIIKVGTKKVILQLVKNPGGFRHALLSGNRTNKQASMIAINDNYADGRDVSWLWDVNFENYRGLTKKIYTSGSRACDMALRLKYDDIKVEAIEPNLAECLNKTLDSINEQESIIIYTTYTAMLELRKILSLLTEVEKI